MTAGPHVVRRPGPSSARVAPRSADYTGDPYSTPLLSQRCRAVPKYYSCIMPGTRIRKQAAKEADIAGERSSRIFYILPAADCGNQIA